MGPSVRTRYFNPTVVATALFFNIISLPQVALNLAAQVT
jgi:hypothetical protein